MVEIKTYLNYKCTDVPNSHFEDIIKYLLREASFRMDCSIPGDVPVFTQQLLWVIKDKYPFLPIHKLQEAFYKGALGEIGGTMKLSIRNVNIWIKEINQAWSEGAIARRNRELMQDVPMSELADKYSAAAYSLRIQWGCQKRVTRSQWNYLTTRHDDMKDKVKAVIDSGGDIDSITPGMFLSGWTEPAEIDESMIGKIFG